MSNKFSMEFGFEVDRFIKTNANMMSDREIALHFGVSVNFINLRRRDLGVIRAKGPAVKGKGTPVALSTMPFESMNGMRSLELISQPWGIR